MKQDIHPEYNKMKIKCVCGNEIETGSIEENITVEICNNCHPFYTGNQKIMDTEMSCHKVTNQDVMMAKPYCVDCHRGTAHQKKTPVSFREAADE